MDLTLDCAGLNHMTVTESGKGAGSIYKKAHIRLLGSNHVVDGLRGGLFCRPNPRKGSRRSIGLPTPAYSATITLAFGASPNTSGAYIASTRVAGSENSPELFSRNV